MASRLRRRAWLTITAEWSTPTTLSIGELSERTGVPTSALRYYGELGLVRPTARVAGRRRYAASAVSEVDVVLFLREIGFTLAEIGHFLTGERQDRRDLMDRKMLEPAEQQHRIEVARTALDHGRRCPADDPVRCSRFLSSGGAASRWRKATRERTDGTHRAALGGRLRGRRNGGGWSGCGWRGLRPGWRRG
ncbi:MerR family transcriptional regulator [Actinosynnema sp. NPDC091369]